MFISSGTVVVVATDPSTGERKEIDELGMGSVFGEIACLLGCSRLASIIATSPGLLFTISGSVLRELTSSNSELANRLWRTCGCRLSENLLVRNNGKPRREIREMIQDMNIYHIDPIRKHIRFNALGDVVLLQGFALVYDGKRDITEVVEAPDILSDTIKLGDNVEFSTDAKFMCHPLSVQLEEDNESIITTGLSGQTSMGELELKAARSFTRQTSGLYDLTPTRNSIMRRHSTQLGSIDDGDLNFSFNRRSTIHIGSNPRSMSTRDSLNVEEKV